MRNGFIIFIITSFLMVFTSEAMSQFRSDLPSPYERTGTITHPADSEDATNVLGLFDMSMSQSYEMTFGGIGSGQSYNQNIFTNTMHMRFNEDFHGRVDVAMSHSPFGNSPMGQQQDFNVFIRNAELQYDISDNSTIRLQYRQEPAGYGYQGGPFGRSPYGHHRHW